MLARSPSLVSNKTPVVLRSRRPTGHLVLGKSLLGLGETGMRLDVCLHVGTLVAVFAFYWSSVRKLLKGLFSAGEAARESWSYAARIILSAVPAGVVGVLFGGRRRGVGIGDGCCSRLGIVGGLFCCAR